ncbi:hypothetical protein DPMN_009805 [Dreissena polymorpha]|uniref:Uncharacterized protein n=1 Tax=Dreissena polymorpha TaxID=45954 RepID=A0A9D4N2X8_DREPO|nr:hypothetical protein DPMN_009805 [Dreissena polymorpha]
MENKGNIEELSTQLNQLQGIRRQLFTMTAKLLCILIVAVVSVAIATDECTYLHGKQYDAGEFFDANDVGNICRCLFQDAYGCTNGRSAGIRRK